MIQHRLLDLSIIFLLLCNATPANAVPVPSFERLGDSAYVHRIYDSAIIFYDDAIRTDNSQAITWYKLGNAHYRMHHIGQAVLCYERALARKPGFIEAADNLALIQRQIELARHKQPLLIIRLWESTTHPSNTNILALLAFFFISLPLVVIAYGRFAKRKQDWLRPQLIGACLAIGICFSVMAIVAAFRNKPRNIGVIMRPDAPLLADAKGINKTAMINLPEGLVVKIISKKSDGVRVSLPDGREGLLQPSDIAVLE